MKFSSFWLKCTVSATAFFLPGLAPQLAAKNTPSNKPDKRPNIILILSDDMGYSDLGCYGSEISTPNLDTLAANGLRFTQFYNSARCCPTRASLLTGLHPHQTGIGWMAQDQGTDSYRGHLNKNCVTIAEALKLSGYDTFMTGKWHVAGDNYNPKRDTSNWPCQRGFNKYYGTLRGAASYFDPHALFKNNTPTSAYNDDEYKPQQYYYTDAISDYSCKFIKEHLETSPDQPFFTYIAYTAAHWPLQALENDIEKYDGKYTQGYHPVRRARFEKMKQLGLISQDCTYSETVGSWDDCTYKQWESRCMQVYAAMVTNMDQGIGRIVATLEQYNQLDNTIILFLQDNGGCAESMGRDYNKTWNIKPRSPLAPEEFPSYYKPPVHTRQGLPVLGGKNVLPGPANSYIAYGRNWANVSNTPFREYKHWLQEGGISTPLIVHWPAGINKNSNGQLRHQLSEVIDIMATCVDLAHAEYPKKYNDHNIQPMEGISLLDAFNNSSTYKYSQRPLCWEHEGNRAIRLGDWKLVSNAYFNQSKKFETYELLPLDQWQLFNLATDRAETNDLAKQYPEKVKQLAQQWQSWAKRINVFPKPKRINNSN